MHRPLVLLSTLALLLGQGSSFAEEKETVDQFPPGKFVPLFDGKSLEGWRVIDKNDFERHGEVSVEKGAMVLERGQAATGVSYQRPMPRMNYEVRLEAKRIEGSDFFCGMTFPVGKDYLTLILGGWGGGVTGISNLDNISAVENETTGYVDFKQDRWYKVRLRVTDEKVEAWVDKEQIVDVKHADRKLSIWWEQEPVRPFGIATWDTTGAIRNVQLRRLAAAPTAEQQALLKTFRDEFVAITPGEGEFPKSFSMGSDAGSSFAKPVHRVTFDYPFAVAKYEVPQNLWQAVMGENPSRWKGDRNSVEMLSFDDAVQFCQLATDMMRAAELIEPSEAIRLPSEAEWEYFTRAGTETRYSFGDDPEKLDDYGWHTGNAAGNDPPVGAKKPNPWGLYDVHGYLWEWCADAAHENYEGAPTDGSAWLAEPGDDGSAEPMRRVIRGGSWKDPAEALTSYCRSARFRGTEPGSVIEMRGGIPAETKDDAIGLRCVLAEAEP